VVERRRGTHAPGDSTADARARVGRATSSAARRRRRSLEHRAARAGRGARAVDERAAPTRASGDERRGEGRRRGLAGPLGDGRDGVGARSRARGRRERLPAAAISTPRVRRGRSPYRCGHRYTGAEVNAASHAGRGGVALAAQRRRAGAARTPPPAPVCARVEGVCLTRAVL